MKYKIILILLVMILWYYSVNSYNEKVSNQNEYNEAKRNLLEEIKNQEPKKSISKTVYIEKKDDIVYKKEVQKNSENLNVQFYPQSPYWTWDKYMSDACEEASVLIGINYIKNINMTRKEFKDELLKIIDWENKTFWYFKDTNVEETNTIIKDYYNYSNTEIIKDPTIEDIKSNLSKWNIIITPLYWKGLNPNFINWGPKYHFIVIKWFEGNMFITHEVWSKYWEDYKYTQNDIMHRIHDFNKWDVINWEKKIIVIKK